MEQLARLLQGLQSAARAQAVLKTLVVVLDDVLSQPQENRHVVRDEITPVGAKLLESCGFVDDPVAGELRLPPGADLRLLREAREDLGLLLRKAELGVAAVAPGAAAPGAAAQPPKAATAAAAGAPAATAVGPLAAAPAAAMALQLAAASVSPTVNMPALLSSYLSDDQLGAASPSSYKPKPRDRDQGPSSLTRTVPASVTSAAAAVGHAMAAGALPSGVLAAALRGGELELGFAKPPAGQAPAAARATGGGGDSRWTAAPENVLPESRLVVPLPQAEFTYIDRPWKHFVTRWAGIDVELARHFGEQQQFTLLDLGSCCGFFSLQAAAGYPNASVIGIEGSVGIGNGTTGVDGTEDQIIQTKAIQTHLRWIDKLYLSNCLLAPEVWDYRRVCQLAALGRPICDAMLSLSVIHHIDNISTQLYTAAKMTHLEGTLSLMAKLLLLSPRHFIELPDRPWIEHVHIAYGTPRAFLEAAVKLTGRQWSFVGPLCISEWYGTRELWLLEDAEVRSALPAQGLKSLFPRCLGVSSGRAPPAGGQAAAAPVLPAAAPAAPVAAPQPPAPPLAAAAPEFRPPPQAPPAPEPAKVPPAVAQPLPFPQRPQVSLGPLGSPLSAEELGAALLAAPTALIATHVQLRDALAAAEGMLHHARTTR